MSSWTLDVHHYFHLPDVPADIAARLDELKGLIVMNHAELAAALATVGANVDKIGAETRTLIQRIADLEDAIGQADDVPQNVLDALSALQAQVAVVDDLVPDAP